MNDSIFRNAFSKIIIVLFNCPKIKSNRHCFQPASSGGGDVKHCLSLRSVWLCHDEAQCRYKTWVHKFPLTSHFPCKISHITLNRMDSCPPKDPLNWATMWFRICEIHWKGNWIQNRDTVNTDLQNIYAIAEHLCNTNLRQ